MQQNKLLTTKEVAEILGCHIDTLQRWRKKNYGPAPVRVGRLWKYTEAEVNAYLGWSSTFTQKENEVSNDG